jgi:hypothetical protein
VVVLSALWAAPAWAQRANGPYAGLFDGGEAAESLGQSLQFRGSLFGTWDDVAVADPDRSAVDERWLDSRLGAGGQGALSYMHRSQAVRLAADGGSELRIYPDAGNLTAVAHRGGSDLEVGLGRAVTLKANGAASYSSFYQFAPFLDAGVGEVGALESGFGFAAAAERNARLVAGAGMGVTATRRTTLNVDLGWSEWRFLDRPEYSIETRTGGASLRHQLTRRLALRAGAGYQEARFRLGDAVELWTIDLGADYHDTLTFARRTALSFGSSLAAVRIDEDTYYRANGGVTLSRGFRRTWVAYAGAARTTSFLAGFRAPVLADSVNIGFGGLPHRRVRWRTGVAYSRGAIGFEGSNRFTTYSGATRVEIGFLRQLGLYGQYAYYHYRIPRGSSAAALVPQFARQAVSAGLIVWVPIRSDARSPRDTR